MPVGILLQELVLAANVPVKAKIPKLMKAANHHKLDNDMIKSADN